MRTRLAYCASAVSSSLGPCLLRKRFILVRPSSVPPSLTMYATVASLTGLVLCLAFLAFC